MYYPGVSVISMSQPKRLRAMSGISFGAPQLLKNAGSTMRADFFC
jgi:hypothetical protein